MKKRIFLPDRFCPLFWLVLHLGLPLVLAICFLCGVRYSISTSLTDIMPASSDLRAVQKAQKSLSENTERTAAVLCAAGTFDKAKDGAKRFCSELEGSTAFERIDLLYDSYDTKEMIEFIHKNRWLLLDKDAISLLRSDAGAREFAQNALAAAYGSFTLTPAEYFESDPFLLTECILRRTLDSPALRASSFSLKDDVLARELDGLWYVLLQIKLSASGASLSNKESGIKQIYSAAKKTQESASVQFIYSGVPFHSYESSSKAQREISVISAVCMILIVLLLLCLFKSVLPVLLCAGAIAVSAVFALALSLLLFRHIHILTFVFGTTLIGTCLDYSVHFFVNYRLNKSLSSALDVRYRLLKSLSLSLASTEICYAVLAFSPFPLLRQVGVFSFAGIISAYLTVMCLYPYLKIMNRHQGGCRNKSTEGRPHLISAAKRSRIVIAALFALFTGIAIANRRNLVIDNNLSALYTVSGELLESEKASSRVMNMGAAGWYYIVQGHSAAELLENEQRLANTLDSEIGKGNLSSYAAATLLIPPVSQQLESWNACFSLLPYAAGQLETLGFPSSGSSLIEKSYESARGELVRPDSQMPKAFARMMSSLWIGEIAGEWYSVVLPMQAKSEKIFREIAAKDASFYFINNARDISAQLNNLTRLMLLLLLASYILILALLKLFYPLRIWAGMAVIPVFVAMAVSAVMALSKIPLGFFSVTAIILVFGLGLDYIIYTTEAARSSSSQIAFLAITVSFATTVLSFGALSLCAFPPARIFGIIVASGLSASYICSLFPLI